MQINMSSGVLCSSGELDCRQTGGDDEIGSWVEEDTFALQLP